MKDIVEILRERCESISTMESCSGGALANWITNIEGASEVFKFGAVTYANEYKVKMGVSEETIKKYSVYSMQVAKEMSKSISDYTLSTYGVGITGKLKRSDINNQYGLDNQVFISIYNRNKDNYETAILEVDKQSRWENKELVIQKVEDILKIILKS